MSIGTSPVSNAVQTPVLAPTDTTTDATLAQPVVPPDTQQVRQPVGAPVRQPVVQPVIQPVATPVAVTVQDGGAADTTISTTVAPTVIPTFTPTQKPQEPSQSPAPTTVDGFQYHDTAREKWATALPRGTGLYTGNVLKGNNVALSPDGLLLYVTRDNGRLDVLNPSDGTLRWSYEPSAVAPNYYPVHCTSGVYFGSHRTMGDFAVYTIIDEPPFPVADFEDATR